MRKKNWIFEPLKNNVLQITPISNMEKQSLQKKKRIQLSKYRGQNMGSTSNWITGWKLYNDK